MTQYFWYNQDSGAILTEECGIQDWQGLFPNEEEAYEFLRDFQAAYPPSGEDWGHLVLLEVESTEPVATGEDARVESEE